MVNSRTLTAAAGLAIGLVISVVAYVQYDTLLVLFVLPFVPILFRNRAENEVDSAVKECPVCAFRTTDPAFTYCPRDGHRLEE
jgi:hypothetical protein